MCNDTKLNEQQDRLHNASVFMNHMLRSQNVFILIKILHDFCSWAELMDLQG